MRFQRLLLIVALAALVLSEPAAQTVCSAAEPAAASAEVGAALVRDSDLPGGICVVVGSADAQLPLAIAQNSPLVVQALYPDAERGDRARQVICDAGVYGRVSVGQLDDEVLPYSDNLINLLVVDRTSASSAGGPAVDEILRVLAPLGLAYVRDLASDDADWGAQIQSQAQAAGGERVGEIEAGGRWLKIVKKWPEDIDEWTHFLHGPDGNAVADDRVVGPPQRYQWLGGPAWAQSHESDTNLRCLVTARGRLYYIVNEAPTSLAGPESPPDKWFLAARDAFNGVPLWKTPIEKWGWRQWKPSWFTPRPGVIPLNLDKRLVAAGNRVYVTLGFRAPVSEIDGRTGQVLRTFGGTARTSEILYVDDSLILTVLQDDGAIVKRIDVESGRQVWQSERAYRGTTTDYYRFTAMRGSVPEAKVDPTLAIATDGHAVALLDGDSVVGLDFAEGRQRWRTEFPLAEADHNAGRIEARQKVWNGALIVADGVVVHASPNQLAAFSAQSGKVVWQQPKKFLQHLWYEWQDVFLIDGLVWTWSAELARGPLEGGGNSTWPVSLNGYDLHGGRLKREIPLGNIFKTHHHHRCYRNKATVRYVIASRRGSEFVDLERGAHSVHNWVRGACHMGMVPANGLQYAPPHPCQCYIDEKLNGFNALAAERETKDEERSTKYEGVSTKGEERLRKGPAFDDVNTTPSSSPLRPSASWPTYRGDAARSGSVHTALPRDLTLLWQVTAGDRPGAPISVDDMVFVPLVDEHQIVALRADDGAVLWRFTAGARIDSPPTYDRGAVLFGSADGCVYRLRATDGQLVWRLCARPAQRLIGAFGQLESAWPVHGSVLVDDGVAYFVAGRSSHLDGGLQLIAADALTGEILHEKTLAGPSYTVDKLQQNYRLPMGVLPDILRMEDGALFMRSIKFDTTLAQQRGVPRLKVQDGFLDDAYFKRMPWAIGRSGHARVLAYDDTRAYCLRMFDSLQGLDPKVYFTPGKEGYLLFAHDLLSGKNAWAQRIPVRGRALAVTDDQLCVAGPPDVVDPDDPLAAFEGRLGGVLRVVGKSDGQTVSEYRLTAPPVFNGVAAANGRLILSLEDGSVACLGRNAE
jgi:outer membrane protein assembly factor BamB